MDGRSKKPLTVEVGEARPAASMASEQKLMHDSKFLKRFMLPAQPP